MHEALARCEREIEEIRNNAANDSKHSYLSTMGTCDWEYEKRLIRAQRKPLCIDLFCGLGGWTEGLLAEGYEVIGFDIKRHEYAGRRSGESTGVKLPGNNSANRWQDRPVSRLKDANKAAPLTFEVDRYPAQLVLQDVLSLHGSQFRNAALIVASPPCQEFSYMAMPWSRAKQIAAALREECDFPDRYDGSWRVADLTALFDACFRIQREACESAGRHIPMVVENVKGAQPWVGMAKAHFGSFYFWGDIESVGGHIVAGKPEFGKVLQAPKRGGKSNPDGTDHPQGSWFKVADSVNRGGRKNEGGSWFAVAHNTESGVRQNPVNGVKVPSDEGRRTDVGKGPRFTSRDCGAESGVKQGGDWFGPGEDSSMSRRFGSKSIHRKAASAQIAKIPFPLAQHIARSFKPSEVK